MKKNKKNKKNRKNKKIALILFICILAAGGLLQTIKNHDNAVIIDFLLISIIFRIIFNWHSRKPKNNVEVVAFLACAFAILTALAAATNEVFVVMVLAMIATITTLDFAFLQCASRTSSLIYYLTMTVSLLFLFIK